MRFSLAVFAAILRFRFTLRHDATPLPAGLPREQYAADKDDPHSMDLLADLTPAQREAVTHVEGPLLVLAGAGSGKTRVITRRVAYMLHAGDRARARSWPSPSPTRRPARCGSGSPPSCPAPGSGWARFTASAPGCCGTHARLVGIDPGFTIYDQADRLRAVKEVMEQLAGRRDSASRPSAVEAAISKAKNDLIGPRSPQEPGRRRRQDGCVARVFAGLPGEAAGAHRRSISTTCSSTWWRSSRSTPTSGPGLDRRYRYVLVDEYQDTNLAQYAIVRALSVDHPNLCVTGDPDQSIYGWRGANLRNILEFEHDYPGCQVVKLERNYRSTKNILQRRRSPDPAQPQPQAQGAGDREPAGRAGRADRLRPRDRRGRGDRRADRQPGPRGRVRVQRHRRVLPDDRTDRGPSSRPFARPRFPTRSSGASRSTNGRRSRTSCRIST